MNDDDRDLARLTASACASGASLNAAAHALLLANLGLATACLLTRTGRIAALLLALATLAIWLWQVVLAARLVLDARIFEAFSQPSATGLAPARFDAARAAAGLGAASGPRPMIDRWRGARALLIRQACCVAVLAILAAAQLMLLAGAKP